MSAKNFFILVPPENTSFCPLYTDAWVYKCPLRLPVQTQRQMADTAVKSNRLNEESFLLHGIKQQCSPFVHSMTILSPQCKIVNDRHIHCAKNGASNLMFLPNPRGLCIYSDKTMGVRE
ncbi:MAG: hypothetical protein IJA67_07085 [Oscillospiraceae bacterium]|nr:hypothetical protein [Oscillospiraceae bacterium]